MNYSPSALKPKYKPTLTMAEITNTIKRVFGENEAKKPYSLLGCTSYSLISRVVAPIRTTAMNFFVSTSTV